MPCRCPQIIRFSIALHDLQAIAEGRAAAAARAVDPAVPPPTVTLKQGPAEMAAAAAVRRPIVIQQSFQPA